MSSTIVDSTALSESLAVASLSLVMFTLASAVFIVRILEHKGYTAPLYLLVLLCIVRITQFCVDIPAILRVNEDRINSKALVTVSNVLDSMGVAIVFMATLLSLRAWVVKVRMGTLHPGATQGHYPKTTWLLLVGSLIAFLNGVLAMVAFGLSVSSGYDETFNYYSTLVEFVNASIYVILIIYLLLTLVYLGSFMYVYNQFILPKSDRRYFWILFAGGALLGLRMIYSFAAVFAAYYDGILLHFFLATLPEVLLLVLIGGFSRTFASIVTNPPIPALNVEANAEEDKVEA